MEFLAIIQLTFLESFAKKTFIAFLGISTFICLLMIFALNLDIVNGLQTSITIFGLQSNQLIDLKKIIVGIETVVAAGLFTGGLFMSLFATSNLIPSMLEEGNIDLLISKPVSRFKILMGRFLGSVAIVGYNIFYLVIFTWLIMSIKTGIWHVGFLLSGIMILLTFAILYSIMTFLGIVIRSSAFSLMITYLILFFSPLLIQRDEIYALLSHKIYGIIVDGLYYFLPKTAELGKITHQLVGGIPVSSWMPLWSSILFSIIIFGISYYIFSRKNF
jgi:ABC-2 type transport system permease protein